MKFTLIPSHVLDLFYIGAQTSKRDVGFSDAEPNTLEVAISNQILQYRGKHFANCDLELSYH